MGSFCFQPGLVISRFGQILEYSARNKNELYFEQPESGQRITIEESKFWAELQTKKLSIVDAFSSPNVLELPSEPQEVQFKNLADLPQKFQDDALRKVAFVRKLQEAGISKGQTRLIADAAKRIAKEIDDKLGVPGTSTIQRWWRQLERKKFEVYAVVNGNSARERSSPLDEESEAFLQGQIDDKYAIETRPTAAGAYREYLSALKARNIERGAAGLTPLMKVAERTFYERINKRPKKDMMIARHGREYARHHFKMVKGHLPAEHPLDVVEIDHTPLNLYVIDDLAFLPLGRPWATAIKDRFSGVLLGFYISFQATGLDSIFGAIKHSLSSHHLAYQLWPELENPWPSFGLGHYYASDRGADFLSPRYRTAIASLGAWYEYCERRTPWLKASIERFFLTLEQTFFEAMPGRTFSCLEMRGDYNPVKDAVVRFSTLIFLFHKWAADFHNIFPNRRKLARPLDLWTDGIEIAPPPYPVSPDQLNIILGEHHKAKLSHEGVRYAWLTYANDSLRELRDSIGTKSDVNFVISNEDLGQIHVLDPRTNQYLLIPCTQPDYASGLSKFQHQYLRKEATIRLKHDTAVDTLIETRALIQGKLQEEIAAKENSAKVRLARVAGINSNAVLEGQGRSVTSPFKGQLIETPPPTEPVLLPSFTAVPRYTWGV